MTYVKDKSVFLQPATHRPYLPNSNLSGVSDEKIADPATTILFYEDAPDAEGIRCVAYADGHTEELTETQFQQQRKAHGISESGYPPMAPKP